MGRNKDVTVLDLAGFVQLKLRIACFRRTLTQYFCTFDQNLHMFFRPYPLVRPRYHRDVFKMFRS